MNIINVSILITEFSPTKFAIFCGQSHETTDIVYKHSSHSEVSMQQTIIKLHKGLSVVGMAFLLQSLTNWGSTILYIHAHVYYEYGRRIVDMYVRYI
jgi:hypothetical protein